MLRSKKMTIQNRILLLLGIFIAGMLLLQAGNFLVNRHMTQNVTMPMFEDQVINGHKTTLKSGVEIMVTSLVQQLQGVTHKTEQYKIIEAETDPVRFYDDKSGYFFTYNTQGIRINVPPNKSKNGQDCIGIKDKNGVPIVKELIGAAQKGGGFVIYHFEKPGKGLQPKLAYSQMIPGTDVLVGAGVYIDNVQEEKAKLITALAESKKNFTAIQVVVYAGIFIGTIILGWLISRHTSRTISIAVKEISLGAEQILNTSTQVAAASQSLAESCSEQAASQEERSASLSEILSLTRQNTDHSQQANQLATNAEKEVSEGTQAIEKMNSAIQKIRSSSDETSRIIKVIDEIAFQTNLLALNAAVEAARAGEAGKGFAVVAEEVRNLAIRSADAARNTTSLIEESVHNANEGVEITEEVNRSLELITGSISKTSQIVSEIAEASGEQTQGLEQVSSSVSEIDKATQQNAAIAEESASASEELKNQTQKLNHVMISLRELVGENQSSESDSSGGQFTDADQLYHDIAHNQSTRSKASLSR